jgi:uncharacterized small protein (DUF1192 family)
MDWDEPREKPAMLARKELDPLSIEALHDYIDELKSEIERVQAKISDKEKARKGAEAFFKK